MSRNGASGHLTGEPLAPLFDRFAGNFASACLGQVMDSLHSVECGGLEFEFSFQSDSNFCSDVGPPIQEVTHCLMRYAKILGRRRYGQSARFKQFVAYPFSWVDGKTRIQFDCHRLSPRQVPTLEAGFCPYSGPLIITGIFQLKTDQHFQMLVTFEMAGILAGFCGSVGNNPEFDTGLVVQAKTINDVGAGFVIADDLNFATIAAQAFNNLVERANP